MCFRISGPATSRVGRGRWCFGKTPMQTFLDTLPLARQGRFASTSCRSTNGLIWSDTRPPGSRPRSVGTCQNARVSDPAVPSRRSRSRTQPYCLPRQGQLRAQPTAEVPSLDHRPGPPGHRHDPPRNEAPRRRRAGHRALEGRAPPWAAITSRAAPATAPMPCWPPPATTSRCADWRGFCAPSSGCSLPLVAAQNPA